MRILLLFRATIGGSLWLQALYTAGDHSIYRSCDTMPWCFCIVCFEFAYCRRCACGGCLYCGIACQRQDWKAHKTYCHLKKISEMLRGIVNEDGRGEQIQLPTPTVLLIRDYCGQATTSTQKNDEGNLRCHGVRIAWAGCRISIQTILSL